MPIIHSFLEDIVKQEDGPAGLARVRAIASEQAVGNDPNAKSLAFAAALATARGKSLTDTYRALGAAVVGPIFRAFPILIRANKSTMSLLMHVNQVAPATLEAIVPGVEPPDFDVELLGSDSLRLRFVGSERVAAMVEGVVQGCARHFGETVRCEWAASASALPDRRVLLVDISAPRRPMSATPR